MHKQHIESLKASFMETPFPIFAKKTALMITEEVEKLASSIRGKLEPDRMGANDENMRKGKVQDQGRKDEMRWLH